MREWELGCLRERKKKPVLAEGYHRRTPAHSEMG
jgi:hypothetical protein